MISVLRSTVGLRDKRTAKTAKKVVSNGYMHVMSLSTGLTGVSTSSSGLIKMLYKCKQCEHLRFHYICTSQTRRSGSDDFSAR